MALPAAILFAVFLLIVLSSPWTAQETRPGFDERPEGDRTSALT